MRRIVFEGVGGGVLRVVVGAALTGLVGCAHSPTGTPAAPIDVKDIVLGYQYSQNGEVLDRKEVLRVLEQGGAGVEPEVGAQRRLFTLTQAMSIAGGALIGIPLGLWTSDVADPMWFLAGIGAGTLSVAFPIAYGIDQRLHNAVLRHNLQHGKGSVSSIPPLGQPRTGFLLRTGYSGAYLNVNESIEGVGSAGDLSFTGPGAGYDWSLGYSLIPGLALTASVLAITQIAPSVKSNEEPMPNDELTLLHLTSALGGLNYYPLSDYGLYVQALAGYGAESAQRGDRKVQTDANGLVLAAALGWDWSLGSPGALGAFVRGIYAPLTGKTPHREGTDELSFTNRWTGVAVGFSVTYY